MYLVRLTKMPQLNMFIEVIAEPLDTPFVA